MPGLYLVLQCIQLILLIANRRMESGVTSTGRNGLSVDWEFPGYDLPVLLGKYRENVFCSVAFLQGFAFCSQQCGLAILCPEAADKKVVHSVQQNKVSPGKAGFASPHFA